MAKYISMVHTVYIYIHKPNNNKENLHKKNINNENGRRT